MVQGGFFCSHSGNDNYLPARIRGYTTGIFWHPVPLRLLKPRWNKNLETFWVSWVCAIFVFMFSSLTIVSWSFVFICVHSLSFLGNIKAVPIWSAAGSTRDLVLFPPADHHKVIALVTTGRQNIKIRCEENPPQSVAGAHVTNHIEEPTPDLWSRVITPFLRSECFSEKTTTWGVLSRFFPVAGEPFVASKIWKKLDLRQSAFDKSFFNIPISFARIPNWLMSTHRE